MKIEELNTIRNSYERIKEDQIKAKKVWDRIDDLEQNAQVKEYIELKEMMKKVNLNKKYLSNDEILEICIDGYLSSLSETNNIYVYIGTVELQEKSMKKKYKRYMNLEARYDNHLIPIELSSEFENTHKIVNANNQESYKRLQKEFIKTSMEEGQEKACIKVLSLKR